MADVSTWVEAVKLFLTAMSSMSIQLNQLLLAMRQHFPSRRFRQQLLQESIPRSCYPRPRQDLLLVARAQALMVQVTAS